MKGLIGKFVEVRTDTELKGLLWGTGYGFLIMLSYYILRAVRSASSACENCPCAWWTSPMPTRSCAIL